MTQVHQANHHEKATPQIDPRTYPDQSPSSPYKVLTTIPNVHFLLKTVGVEVGYDVIGKRLCHKIPGIDIAPDNADNIALAEITSLCIRNGLQPGPIREFVDAIADRQRVNPVRAWIESKPWDGHNRLPGLQATLTVREDFPNELKNTLIHKWLLSAVAAACVDEEFRCRGVLTLQGPQSIGKTSWVLSLVPPESRTDFLKVDHHLDPNNKDSILTGVSHWIVEIGELDSSFKKDVARLKGFLTSNVDKVRRPYAKADSTYPRRTVFCATVNQDHFLVDMSGNTRWWTLPVVAIDFNHGIDMQQLFAQLAVEVRQGAQWWLTRDEELLLDAQNQAHLSVSVIRDRLCSYLDSFAADGHQPATKNHKAIEVLELLEIENPSNGQAKECAEVLRERLGPPKRINGANKWSIPVQGSTQRSSMLCRPAAGNGTAPVVPADSIY